MVVWGVGSGRFGVWVSGGLWGGGGVVEEERWEMRGGRGPGPQRAIGLLGDVGCGVGSRVGGGGVYVPARFGPSPAGRGWPEGPGEGTATA